MKFLFFLICFIFSQTSQSAFDHSYPSWGRVIANYVNYQANPVEVDYLGIKENRKDFKDHLQTVVKLNRSDYDKFTSDQKKAFILNAYNALAIKAVLDQTKEDNKLPKSIKDGDTFFTSIFKKKFFNLFGEERNLNYLEKELGKEFQREFKFVVSFACTARSCPPPANYVPEKIEEQMSEIIRQFLKYDRNVGYDIGDNKFLLTDYFEAREDAIKQSKQYSSLKDFIIRHAPISELFKDKAIKNETSLELEFIKMDWGLNKKN
jgi:hypothetical protein